MDNIAETAKTKSIWYRTLMIIGIIFAAFNLRPAITSVGPLVGLIQEDLYLSHWSVGMLTSLPLLAFAVVSPIVPKLANRFTNERTLVLGLIFIFSGIIIRSWITSIILLFTGTLLIGIGIAICNVLLPVIVKDKFPGKIGLMTSVYSTSIGIFASLASGVSVPLAVGLKLGWENSLVVWVIPAIIAIIIWTYLSRINNGTTKELRSMTSEFNRMWKSALAWQVAIFFGFQSILFYVTVTWLPEILVDKGYDIEMAGWLLSFTQIIGLPASFIVPVLAGRTKSQSLLALFLGVLAAIGFGGLLFSNTHVMIITSTILIGLPLSGSFALGLAFLALRGENSKASAELSGMVQSFGYLLSAIGPILIGYLFDYTQSWDIPIVTLIILSILVAIFGVAAGRNRFA